MNDPVPISPLTDERFRGLDRLYGSGSSARLAGKHVCVVGIGGVGSWAVEALARSGIGRLSLIDADDVCLSNTNRQLHALEGQYGRSKVEVMAERGRETLRFGPMKPVGLTNRHHPDIKPYAVVQLRRDNALGTLLNIVGFQTKMKYGAQLDVFKRIPGLETAEFARLGGIHRNSFINSPRLLDPVMRLKSAPHIRFAGQITGVEGYVESAAMGLLAGKMAAYEVLGRSLPPPPPETAMGALIDHITGGADARSFQPMNVNFGLFPPLKDAPTGRRSRKDRYLAYTDRAKSHWQGWLDARQAAC